MIRDLFRLEPRMFWIIVAGASLSALLLLSMLAAWMAKSGGAIVGDEDDVSAGLQRAAAKRYPHGEVVG